MRGVVWMGSVGEISGVGYGWWEVWVKHGCGIMRGRMRRSETGVWVRWVTVVDGWVFKEEWRRFWRGGGCISCLVVCGVSDNGDVTLPFITYTSHFFLYVLLVFSFISFSSSIFYSLIYSGSPLARVLSFDITFSHTLPPLSPLECPLTNYLASSLNLHYFVLSFSCCCFIHSLPHFFFSFSRFSMLYYLASKSFSLVVTTLFFPFSLFSICPYSLYSKSLIYPLILSPYPPLLIPALSPYPPSLIPLISHLPWS